MKPELLLEALRTTEKLKETYRHCYTSGGDIESVAAHSHQAALMAYFLKDDFPDIDISKVIVMLLLHDIGECFTGDIPSFNKSDKDEKRESMLLDQWVASLPEPFCTEMRELYAEMDDQITLEAKLYKAIDSMEAVNQHNLSPISTWEDLEYDLNRTYAWDRVAHSEKLLELRKAIRKKTDEKIARETFKTQMQ